MASCLNLDQAFGVAPPDNGRILRNLVLGANFIQSHLLHFYHLSALDYINTTGLLDMAPFTPRYTLPDMATGQAAADLVDHYLQALAMRRKAHEMGALFGGKLPCTGSFVVGGLTQNVTTENVAAFRTLLNALRDFIDNVYVPDAQALGTLFPNYYNVGGGPGNLLAFGVFDLDNTGTNKFISGGRIAGDMPGTLDVSQITEQVGYSWYTPASGGMNPAQGVTEPDADKPGAYTWLKAPRYENVPYELGPLARMKINGDYTGGISAMDRIVARALETKKIADAMNGWLDQLVPGSPTYAPSSIPTQAVSAGLTEAPRGALGHWMTIENSVISRYQVITPTNWNASPRDDGGVLGPIEGALLGTPVADTAQPVEVLRVVHTFDPCLACAVHMVRPGQRRGTKVLIQPNPM
jgi:hydrogenase large subunit